MMSQTPTTVFETEMRALLREGRCEEATTEILRAYSREIIGFLISMIGDNQLAQDAFQDFSFELWRGLPNFRWESSLRTWAYRLARHVISRAFRDPARRRAVRLATDQLNGLQAQQARTVTEEWRKTEARDRMWQVCQELPEEEKSIVLLRLSRKMSWLEIAEVLHPDGQLSEPAELKRFAAMLRKRFERIKEKLSQLMAD